MTSGNLKVAMSDYAESWGRGAGLVGLGAGLVGHGSSAALGSAPSLFLFFFKYLLCI